MRGLVAASLFCVGASALAQDQRFATGYSYTGPLAAAPYGTPSAALGAPTTWIRDTINGGPDQRIAASLAYGPWQTAPNGDPLVVTVPIGAALTLEFDPPIQNRAANWYGMDFIVFGNAFFVGTPASWNTNMDAVRVNGSGAVFAEQMTVSVSPDGVQWYTYSTFADGLWPTQAFAWTNGAWGEPQDATKPLPPSLVPSQVAGRTFAEAIRAYRGSGGGTAYDLSPSGFSQVRYIRLTGAGAEVDAVSRVGLVGDVDGDGDVDIDDYDRLAFAYGSFASVPTYDVRADLDDDDDVDIDDYDLLAGNYGR